MTSRQFSSEQAEVFNRPRQLVATADRGPLRTLFLLTSAPVGGAETLLVDLVRRLDRDRFHPEVACLKELDVLGEILSNEVPTAAQFLSSKYDIRVLPRLIHHLRKRRIDALVTVGAGDKMFWGRLAAYFAKTPVVISALHSTGWPDGIGRLNKLLTPLTDAFVGVAANHGRFLQNAEGLPAGKVRVIPNGVDTRRFRKDIAAGNVVRQALQIPLDAAVCGIVAALRPEKNHELFLRAAQQIRRRIPDTHYLIVGDGQERSRLEDLSSSLGLDDALHFLGTRNDVPSVLAAMNALLLTSRNEANPVSILEALATEVPVVATRVGSVGETVIDNETGFLVDADHIDDLVARTVQLLSNPDQALRLGRNGRQLVVSGWSVDKMVAGYEDLITEIYNRKATVSGPACVAEESAESPVHA